MCQCISILPRVALLISILGACRSAPRPVAPSQREPEIAITHVSVIDPSTGQPAPDMTVIIRGRVIRDVGPSATLTVPREARVVDARGKYLIPGLWDMHVHTLLDGRAWALGEYVRHGITSVRDMGGQFEAVDSLRREVAAGRITGPRILAGGPMIENAAAMRGILADATADDSARAKRDRLEISTPAAAARAVDSLARLGVDFIKARDFADTSTYWAISNAARRAGKSFFGHPPAGIDPFALADSGQRSVEHWYYPNELLQLPPADYDRLIAAYVRRGTAFVPTIAAWHQHRLTTDTLERMLAAALADPRADHARGALLHHWQKELASRRAEIQGRPATREQLGGWNRVLDAFAREMGRMSAAGVVVLAASDLPFAAYPGDALHDELRYLVREAGLTPRQALAAATVAPARFLGMQDSLGTIAAGKLADLVLLSADPLVDIDNVRRVAAVMRAGKWVWERSRQSAMESR